MIISMIVATAENGVIGRGNKIPWKMPAELANFKKITMGHPLIMGRKTHESIGRTLPGRRNIVVTRQKDYRAFEGSEVAGSIKEALERTKNQKEVFIIGGVNVYEQAMPLTERLYLTKVHAELPGDKIFRFNPTEWRQIKVEKYKADKDNQYDYDFMVLDRIKQPA